MNSSIDNFIGNSLLIEVLYRTELDDDVVLRHTVSFDWKLCNEEKRNKKTETAWIGCRPADEYPRQKAKVAFQY